MIAKRYFAMFLVYMYRIGGTLIVAIYTGKRYLVLNRFFTKEKLDSEAVFRTTGGGN